MDFKSYSRYLFLIRLHDRLVHNKHPGFLFRRHTRSLRHQKLRYMIDEKLDVPICLECGAVFSEMEFRRLEKEMLELLKNMDIKVNHKTIDFDICDEKRFDRQRVPRYNRFSGRRSYRDWFFAMWETGLSCSYVCEGFIGEGIYCLAR